MDIRLVCLNCDRAIEIPTAGEDHPCPLCGASVSVELPPEPDVPGLGTAFLYPFSSLGSVLFLLCMAPLWAVLRTWPGALFGLFGHLIVGGYIATWLWDILASTAVGRHRAPGPPQLVDVWELAAAFLRFVGALLVSFAPAVAAAVALNDIPRQHPLHLISVALVVAGLFYYPMALLLIGFSERWVGALHVSFGIRSILLIPRDYLLCCVFVLLAFGASAGAETAVAALPSEVDVPWRMLAYGAAVFVELALYAAQMRAVGLLYLGNRGRLGWFRS